MRKRMSRSTIAGTPRERIFMPLSGNLRIRSKKFCGKIWQKISIFIELPFVKSCLEICCRTNHRAECADVPGANAYWSDELSKAFKCCQQPNNGHSWELWNYLSPDGCQWYQILSSITHHPT